MTFRRRANRPELHPDQIIRVQEEERRHIARELHDEIGQALTAAVLNLEFYREQPVPEDARAEVVADLKATLARVRDLSLNLRPPLIDDAGLEPALRWYGERQAHASRLPIDVEVDAGRVHPNVEITAFRIVQEAITNALRHARASRVAIRVMRSAGELAVEVRDDGAGFDVASTLADCARGRSLGLLGLCERAALVGGTCEITSTAGGGTTVRALLPTGE